MTAKLTIDADRVHIEITADVGAGDLFAAVQGIVAAAQQAPMLALPAPAAAPERGITEKQAKILNLLAEHPGLNTAQILDRLEVDPKSTQRPNMVQVIVKMHQSGKIAALPDDEFKKRKRWIVGDGTKPSLQSQRPMFGALAAKADDVVTFCSLPRSQAEIRRQFDIKSGSGIHRLLTRLVVEDRLARAPGDRFIKTDRPAKPLPKPKKTQSKPEANAWRDKVIKFLATQKEAITLKAIREAVHDTRPANSLNYVMYSLQDRGLVKSVKIDERVRGWELVKPKAKAA